MPDQDQVNAAAASEAAPLQDTAIVETKADAARDFSDAPAEAKPQGAGIGGLAMSPLPLPNPAPETLSPVVESAPAEDAALAKAIENGYREPLPPSRQERIETLLADVQHAMQSNAPMSPAIFAEMKALLLGDE